MAEQSPHVQREERHRLNSIYWGARYEGAYSQITTRILARESIQIGYIAAAITLTGAAVINPAFRALVMVIPFLALAVSLLLASNENVILQQERYLADVVEDVPDDWFNRRRVSQERIDGLRYRTGGLLIAIGGSSLAAIVMSFAIMTKDNFFLWVAAAIAGVVAAIYVVVPRVLRARQYRAWLRMP